MASEQAQPDLQERDEFSELTDSLEERSKRGEQLSQQELIELREQRAAAARMRLLAQQPSVGVFDPLFSNYCLNGSVKYSVLAGLLTTAHFFRKRDIIASARRGVGTALVVSSLYFGQCRMRTDAAEMREKEEEIRTWLETNQEFAERYSKQKEEMRRALEESQQKQQEQGDDDGSMAVESKSDS